MIIVLFIYDYRKARRIDLYPHADTGDQNQIMMWKKNKRYYIPQKTFNENMAERRKVGEVKKDGHNLDV